MFILSQFLLAKETCPEEDVNDIIPQPESFVTIFCCCWAFFSVMMKYYETLK